MVRLGVVNIDTSHPKAFSEILHKGNRARYVAVYNDGFRGDEEVEGFIRMAGLEKRCSTVEELAGMSDLGMIQGCNWDKHLSYIEPFVKLGKPVFIDKPIVGNMRDLRKLREYAARGAVILGASCQRYAPGITDFLAIPAEERGEIVSVFSICGVDEFNYAIHAVESIGGLVGTGVVSCEFSGGAGIGGVRGETYTVRYANGVIAVYSITYGQWQKSVWTVLTSKRSYVLDVSNYDAMLDRVVASVETGAAQTAPLEDLIESILIMLAGRVSRERGGGPVRLADIPADYPGYDGDEFERGYAANAKKLYN
jgi:predicted dehydrogenase